MPRSPDKPTQNLAAKAADGSPLQLTEDNPYTRLTIQQKNYVEARLQGLNKAASGRAAGLSSPQASLNMEKNPKVRAAIRYLIRESAQKVDELTKSDVLSGMMDAVNAASTASELVMAWREIGKLLGVYEPERKVVEMRDLSKQELKELPDSELAKLAGDKMRTVVDGEYTEVDGHTA